MAAGKWKVYNRAKVAIGNGTLDLSATADWKLALFTSSSNANTLSLGSATFGALTNEHANANGYVTGGAACTSETWTASTGTVTFDAADVVWTAAGGSITARLAVIYRDATINGIVKPLLCVCVLDTAPADVTATDTNTFTVTMHADGILTLSGADVD